MSIDRGYAVCLLLLLGLSAGCRDTVHTEYGRRRGLQAANSLNGTSVLAHMFQQSGHRVSSWRRLSPKLDREQVIVWVPDDFAAPDQCASEVSRSLVECRTGKDAGLCRTRLRCRDRLLATHSARGGAGTANRDSACVGGRGLPALDSATSDLRAAKLSVVSPAATTIRATRRLLAGPVARRLGRVPCEPAAEDAVAAQRSRRGEHRAARHDGRRADGRSRR